MKRHARVLYASAMLNSTAVHAPHPWFGTRKAASTWSLTMTWASPTAFTATASGSPLLLVLAPLLVDRNRSPVGAPVAGSEGSACADDVPNQSGEKKHRHLSSEGIGAVTERNLLDVDAIAQCPKPEQQALKSEKKIIVIKA